MATTAYPAIGGRLHGCWVRGMWLFSLPVVVEHSAQLLETEPALKETQWLDLNQQADVIVVPGAGWRA